MVQERYEGEGMSGARKSWGPDHHPSYARKLPTAVTVTLHESDGALLDTYETAFYGWELTQEVLMVVWGQMDVHKGSYIVISKDEA